MHTTASDEYNGLASCDRVGLNGIVCDVKKKKKEKKDITIRAVASRLL